MKYGLFSGILWGLDTVVLGIALSMSPYIGTAEAIAFAAIASSFLHDAGCALWLLVYMGAKKRLGDTLKALKTKSGLVVVLGALLGGPIGMTGYVIAINNIGAAKAMALNISYSAWAVVFGFVLQGTAPSPATVFFCILILAGTVLAASDWNELFGKGQTA